MTNTKSRIRTEAAFCEVFNSVRDIVGELGVEYALPAIMEVLEMAWMNAILTNQTEDCSQFSEKLQSFGKLVNESSLISTDCELSIEQRVDKLIELTAKTRLQGVGHLRDMFVGVWKRGTFVERLQVHAEDEEREVKQRMKNGEVAPEDMRDELSDMVERLKAKAKQELDDLGMSGDILDG